MTMQKEIEIKFLWIDKDSIRIQLKDNGFVCMVEEFLMQRKTFHPIESNKKEWFRVRRESDKVTMTYKCIHSNDLSGTEEVEIVVDSYENASEMLIKAGLKNTSNQENMRECWRLGEIEVCIDTWPGLRPYIEIEAPTEKQVIFMVEKFGLNFEEGLYGWSETAYEKELWIPVSELVTLSEITFANPPKINNIF